MAINDFIKKRPYLVWGTRNYDTISENAIVENVLNYGDFTDVKEMFSILGIKKAAVIFRKQISQKRNNYRPKIKNYFNLYFKKYAYDFDLFTLDEFEPMKIRKKITGDGFNIDSVFVNESDQYTVLINGVKMTFLQYPFKIEFNDNFDGVIKVADLLTLVAMKAYALGRRAKWKDYVDIYFILKNYHTTAEIAERAKEIFSSEFNEKNFRAQLAYFDDIDYTEKVIYHKGFEVDDKVIKDNLIDFSLN